VSVIALLLLLTIASDWLVVTVVVTVIAWSVCLSVGHSCEPWVSFLVGTRKARNHVYDGGLYPQGKGQFWGDVA